MQKVASILLIIIILLSACSVIRKGTGKRSDNLINIASGKVLDATRDQNISESSFIIQKADVAVSSKDATDKLIASVKYSINKEFLISIRNRAGIEAARIYLTPDTILINDRINREQLCASTGYLKNKYGLSVSVLPLLFGDFIGQNILRKNTRECVEGILTIDCVVDGLKIRYLIDCKIGKPVSATVESGLSSEGIEFQYREFIKYGSKWIPGEIEIRNLLRETVITISLDRISLPWDGYIEFIPGKRYEIIELQ